MSYRNYTRPAANGKVPIEEKVHRGTYLHVVSLACRPDPIFIPHIFLDALENAVISTQQFAMACVITKAKASGEHLTLEQIGWRMNVRPRQARNLIKTLIREGFVNPKDIRDGRESMP